MRKISSLLVLLLAITLFTSCQKEPIDKILEPVAPELPAVESFVMPFTGFEDSDTSGIVGGSADEKSITSFHNWFYSASNVVLWSVGVHLNLSIPIASFHEAFNATPEYQGDNVWTWTYVANVDSGVYQCELTGEILNADELEWTMHISKAGAFSDVLWYTGITSVDGNKGTWTLNHRPNNPQSFIGIEYAKDDNAAQSSIRYTNLIPNSADNGDYIEYNKANNSSATYDRGYDVFKNNQNNLLEIEWNSTLKFGRVKNKGHFGDTDWHCWDEDLMDVECS